MELFEVQPGLMIWTVTAFVVLLVLLWRFVYKPLLGVLDDRGKRISESMDKADETRNEAERLLTEYKKQLKEAKTQAQQIIEDGKKLGEKTKQEIVAVANDQAQDMLVKAKKQIEQEREKAVKEIQKASAELIVTAASQVIGKSLSGEDHQRLIEKYLGEVKLN